MKEYRNFKIEENNSDRHILKGMPIVFNERTLINDVNGSYYEIIRPEALNETDLSDCHLFYNHDLNKVPLARTSKTMQLSKTPAGVEIIAELSNTEDANNVYTAVKRGDLTGMSFGFVVPDGGDEFDATTNTRTINKISKVYEFSVVPYPAYPTTSVEARNKIDNANEQLYLKNKLKIELNKLLYKG